MTEMIWLKAFDACVQKNALIGRFRCDRAGHNLLINQQKAKLFKEKIQQSFWNWPLFR